MRRIGISTLALAAVLSGVGFAHSPPVENWPQFRGPDSNGLGVEDPRLPLTWSRTENVRWSIPVPGRGWSSPVVWGDRIILTSVISEGLVEAPMVGIAGGGQRLTPPTATHHWMVYCFDWRTGEPLWEREVHRGPPSDSLHVKNSYASETAVTDGERVYAYFGNLGLFALDLEGNPLWERRMGFLPTKLSYGPGSSPALHEDRLFLVRDNEEQSFIAAIDKLTGEEIWRADRDEPTTWATPFVWRNGLRAEVVTVGVNRVRSYSPAGELLWELGDLSRTSVPMPFAAHDLVYVASGLYSARRRPVYAIRPGASGDITLASNQSSNEFVAWTDATAAPYVPSVLVYGDYYYTQLDRGFFMCHDARTGEPIYDKQRISGDGPSFSASPWAYKDRVFCLSDLGDTYAIQAGPEFKVLGVNSLGEMALASPAILRGDLLIRTASRLYRIGTN
jgi:outer membrane protein assembly factor BamB